MFSVGMHSQRVIEYLIRPTPVRIKKIFVKHDGAFTITDTAAAIVLLCSKHINTVVDTYFRINS